MAKKKKVTKKPKVDVMVGPERRGTVRSREFGVVEDGKLKTVVEVAHVKETSTGKGESFIAQKDSGRLRVFPNRKQLAASFPKISHKFPKLR